MLEYIALTILIVMVIFIIYLVIYIHDIPYLSLSNTFNS